MAKKKPQYQKPHRNLVNESISRYKYEIDKSIPEFYAVMAITLADCCNLGGDDISYLFAYSQKKWQDYSQTYNIDGMFAECNEKTGLLLMRGDRWDGE